MKAVKENRQRKTHANQKNHPRPDLIIIKSKPV